MAEEPRKRSRFDQTEPDPPRKSRFDRRSRSPQPSPGQASAARRSRSPGERAANGEKKDPAAAAAAAAARINAQLQAKKADAPPIHSPSTPGAANTPKQDAASNSVSAEIYQQDGDFIKDIEVNDLRNRYTLTKGSTQKMIKEDTGADVTTRGNYYPDKAMATAANPPLYLHVTSQTKDGLEKAVAKIEELMQQELPSLVDERRFRRREPREEVERDELGRRKWPEERVNIDLEPIPGFNLRAQVVGHGGAYVKHIQAETRCRVQIKGRGSGFTERDTQLESDDPMYLHVTGPNLEEVQQAKQLCIELLDTVRDQYQQFKARGGRQRDHYGGGGGGGDSYGGGYGGRGDGRGGYGRDQGGYGDHQAPHGGPPGGGDANPGAGQDPYAAYYQGYGSYGQAQGQQQGQEGDPYAPYGGYEGYVQYYYQWMQHQQQQGGQQGQAPGQDGGYPGAPAAPGAEAGAPGQTATSPPLPPPPGADAQPPPPPPPPGESSGYNAVPPPPGL